MKLSLKLTLVFYSFWLIDFITTFIGLNFMNMYETNPVGKFFFDLGVIGWIITPVITFVLLFLISLFIVKVSERFKPKARKIYLKVCIGMFLILESFVLLNNFSVLFGK